MKYTIEVNNKTVTVTLDGYKGVARCCDEDTFNLQTGIELALERAKVAKANDTKKECCGCNKCNNTNKPTNPLAPSNAVMSLIKQLEAVLPPDGIVVVGKGDKMSNAQRNYLARLIGKSMDDRYDEGYKEGHDSGYNEGYTIGHISGYDEGYADGKIEAIETIQEAVENLID